VLAHGRIERMGRFVRSWPKLTCEHSGGIRVLTQLEPASANLLCCTTHLLLC
jgi:hypothetical protein